jgi:hypothetical protein
MTIVIMADNPSMTSALYDQTVADMGMTDSLPPGCSARIAGSGPDGAWRVITVWDDMDAARAFTESTLRPAQERAGVSPPPGPPVTWEVHQIVT